LRRAQGCLLGQIAGDARGPHHILAGQPTDASELALMLARTLVSRPGFDAEAVAAFKLCSRLEGIMPALEPAHALHQAGLLAGRLGPDGRVLVCLSGRGDKDMESVDGFQEPAEIEVGRRV